MKLKKFPLEWITEDHIFKYLRSLKDDGPHDGLHEALTSVENIGDLYSVDVKSVPPLIMCTMLAAAPALQENTPHP